MKKIGVLPNIDKDINLEYTKSIVSWLLEKECTPLAMQNFKEALVGCEYFENMHDLCKESDFVIVLGGDGTLLDKAPTAALYNKPLIGINLGTLGYLTDVEKSEGQKALDKVFKGEYIIEDRMMLELTIGNSLDNSANVRKLTALNDVYMIRGTMSKMITADIRVNSQYIDTYKADGIIISSASGSTAYNVSAGGPIAKPDLDIMLVTPICPHKIYSRPSIVSGNDIITVGLENNSSEEVIISIDGKNIGNLKNSDILNITKSEYHTSIMRTSNLGFYDILRNKFATSRR